MALEFRAMMDRIFNTDDYEAAVMTLAGSDTDPNSEINVLVPGETLGSGMSKEMPLRTGKRKLIA